MYQSTVFDKHINICCSIDNIAKLISLGDHNAANQAIAMDSYKKYFKKIDIFFS